MKQYNVCYRCAGDKDFWYSLGKMCQGINKPYYSSLEKAMADMAKLVAKKNQGARTERTYCGGIGIDLVIDEDTANCLNIVEYKVYVREVTPWEEVG